MDEARILNEIDIDHKNKYEESIKAFADGLENRITQLKDKANDVEQTTREKYHEQIEKLKSKKEALLEQYQEIKETGEDRWNDVKSDVSKKVHHIKSESEEAYTGIRDGFAYLFDKFKK